jgi:hypothetical protein
MVSGAKALSVDFANDRVIEGRVFDGTTEGGANEETIKGRKEETVAFGNTPLVARGGCSTFWRTLVKALPVGGRPELVPGGMVEAFPKGVAIKRSGIVLAGTADPIPF